VTLLTLFGSAAAWLLDVRSCPSAAHNCWAGTRAACPGLAAATDWVLVRIPAGANQGAAGVSGDRAGVRPPDLDAASARKCYAQRL